MTGPARAARQDTPRREQVAVLLDRMGAGDRDALADLVTVLTPLLWNVARGQGLSRADAEDAVQTTWLGLLSALEDIREPRALVGWLVTAVRRQAWRIRAGSVQQRPIGPEQVEALSPAETAPGPEDRVVADDRAEHLWNTVQQLPERCWLLLRVVAFVDRPDYDVVAHALGMPRGSIGPTRGRCLTKLRGLLAADPNWSTG